MNIVPALLDCPMLHEVLVNLESVLIFQIANSYWKIAERVMDKLFELVGTGFTVREMVEESSGLSHAILATIYPQ